MAADPKQEVRELIEHIEPAQAERLAASLRAGGATSARRLTEADVVLARSVMPGDESAEDLMAAVRRWRRDQGNV